MIRPNSGSFSLFLTSPDLFQNNCILLRLDWQPKAVRTRILDTFTEWPPLQGSVLPSWYTTYGHDLVVNTESSKFRTSPNYVVEHTIGLKTNFKRPLVKTINNLKIPEISQFVVTCHLLRFEFVLYTCMDLRFDQSFRGSQLSVYNFTSWLTLVHVYILKL